MTVATLSDRAGATFTGCEDTTLLSSFPTTNFDTDTGGGYAPLRLPTNSLPGGVVVSDAVLQLVVGTGSGSSGVYNFRRMLRAWVSAEATWNNYNVSSAWGQPGAKQEDVDRSSVQSGTFSYPGGFFTGAIDSSANTQLIADIQNLIDGVYTERSWLIDTETVAGATPFFYSTDATSGNRYQLTVTYSQAPTITVQPQSLRAPPHTTVVFTVTATTSGGTLHYQWKKNGVNVGTDNSTYSFFAESTDRNAQITVAVSDSNGTRQSSAATLSLIFGLNRNVVPPMFSAGVFPNTAMRDARAWF